MIRYMASYIFAHLRPLDGKTDSHGAPIFDWRESPATDRRHRWLRLCRTGKNPSGRFPINDGIQDDECRSKCRIAAVRRPERSAPAFLPSPGGLRRRGHRQAYQHRAARLSGLSRGTRRHGNRIPAGSVRRSLRTAWHELRARRKPRLFLRLPGSFLLRLAERQLPASRPQPPPRLTRLVPDGRYPRR